MAVCIIRFALLLVLALLAGTMFGIWVGADPAGLSASAYVEQQQNMIRSFNTLLPIMGGICILLTVVLAVTTRSRVPFVLAALLLIVAAVVTRFANQPINAIVMTWNPQAPPADWTEFRDRWWHWHVVRTLATIAALAVTLLSVVMITHRQQPV